MNTADSIVTIMNIPQIIQCFSPSSVTLEIRFCPDSRWILILLTILFLLHRLQWRIVEAMPLLENRYWVAQVCHEGSPHSQRIARLHHEGFPRERNQVEFIVSLSKKFHRVAPIARTSQYQFFHFRRPSTVVIPLWITCWREAFHELLM